MSEILMDKLQAQRKWELPASGKRVFAIHALLKSNGCSTKPDQAGEAHEELGSKRPDSLFAFSNPSVCFCFRAVQFSEECKAKAIIILLSHLFA